MTLIDFERLEASESENASEFAGAVPFEHLVVDNFLTPAALAAVLGAIPAPIVSQKSSDYIFARNKFENPLFYAAAPIFTRLRDELLSDRFAAWLSAIYGKKLFVDPQFVGGGLHQGGSGSFLDMHADFSRHPIDETWLRELNILLYLNDDYDTAFGGSLNLRHAVTGATGAIEPRLNRMVVMLTKGHTLHGYAPINFPPGRFRTSIAAYAYSIDTDFAATPHRSTAWRPTDGGPIKTLLARLSPSLVKLKTRFLGSSTARRAQGGGDRQ